MNRSKQITEGAILTAIYVVLLLVSFLIPLIGTLIMIVLPIPFIIFAYKHGWKSGLIMAVAAVLVTFMFSSIITIPMTLTVAIGGIMTGSGLHQKRSSYETWARGTAGFAVGLVLSFLFVQLVFDINISQEIDQQMDMVMEQSNQMIEQFDMGEEAAQQFDRIEEGMDFVKNLLPLAIVFAAILYAFISQWLAYKIINRIDHKSFRFPPFRDLSFPPAILWVYLVAILMTLFQTDHEGMFFIIIQNVVMLAGMLMLIQGLSFIFYYTYHKELSIALPIIVVIFGVFYAPIAFPFIRILGIIDIGFKLRERISKNKK
ncbi:MAG TPA: YybS family protein [Candidatus Avamphibacillus sp.]|nr:YybS family protein [Candidatus Avamphibacillus sp.]